MAIISFSPQTIIVPETSCHDKGELAGRPTFVVARAHIRLPFPLLICCKPTCQPSTKFLQTMLTILRINGIPGVEYQPSFYKSPPLSFPLHQVYPLFFPVTSWGNIPANGFAIPILATP